MSMTPEQKARDMLERMGVEGAQNFSAGDLVELANLIAEKGDMRQLREKAPLVEIFDAAGKLLVAVPVTLAKGGLCTGRAVCIASGIAKKYQSALFDGLVTHGDVVKIGGNRESVENAFLLDSIDLREGASFEVLMKLEFPKL